MPSPSGTGERWSETKLPNGNLQVNLVQLWKDGNEPLSAS